MNEQQAQFAYPQQQINLGVSIKDIRPFYGDTHEDATLWLDNLIM